MVKKIFTFASPAETAQFGIDLGKNAKPGDCFALVGDLGTGKTLMSKAIAQGLGITEEITSPTFTLLEEYPGEIPFYHFDLYRIDNEHELDMLFFEEYWESNGVSVIEWADRARRRIPNNAVWITIEYVNEEKRKAIVEYPVL